MPLRTNRSGAFYFAFGILHASFLLTGGCNVIGVAAQLLPPGQIAPAYKGLQNQTVAVVVWADRGARLDNPTLQMDIAQGITDKLALMTRPHDPKEKPAPELANIRYLNPMSVIRLQEEHPELEGLPSTEIATRLGVTRVIYVEIFNFETHSNLSIDLFKGTVLAKLEVLEVTPGPNKTARVAFTEPDIRTVYPKYSSEGVPGSDMVNGETVYKNTTDDFTSEIALRFMTHEAPQ
jgi:hypothetical protein